MYCRLPDDLFNHFTRQEGSHRVMDQHDIHAEAHFRQGVPYRILPLLASRDYLEHLRDAVGCHDVIEAVFAFPFRDGKNDFMNRGGGL
jgi:hypothetical protein